MQEMTGQADASTYVASTDRLSYVSIPGLGCHQRRFAHDWYQQILSSKSIVAFLDDSDIADGDGIDS